MSNKNEIKVIKNPDYAVTGIQYFDFSSPLIGTATNEQAAAAAAFGAKKNVIGKKTRGEKTKKK